ncbi:transcription factor [Fusarium flagelliforme]|uniref:Transcription factor n=1 Tax=Fusarium flagelliforme TaxID=2675880 RepID=A0A395MUY6_9HYPO|nr:transcription factor [Fusarium flagelliforme]
MAPETPRGVSSKLLTMKFMQRAVASENSSPASETHSSKKRKTEHSPAAGRLDLNINQAAIQAALDAQETKRQEALEKHVGADTRWVLNDALVGSKAPNQVKTPMNVVYVGYGDIDSSNDSGDNEDAPAAGQTQKASDDEEDSEDEDSDHADTPSHARKRKPSTDSPSHSRSRSRSRPNTESNKAKELRDKRKKKEVKLSRPTSISGGGISSGGGSQFSPAGGKSMTCYKCHQSGHKAVDCPKKG